MNWLYAVGIGISFITVVITATWKLSSGISDIRASVLVLEAKVDLIIGNHLAHLDADMQEIKRRLDG